MFYAQSAITVISRRSLHRRRRRRRKTWRTRTRSTRTKRTRTEMKMHKNVYAKPCVFTTPKGRRRRRRRTYTDEHNFMYYKHHNWHLSENSFKLLWIITLIFIRLGNIRRNIDTKIAFLNRWAFRCLFLDCFFSFLSEGVSGLRMGVRTENTVNEIRLIHIWIVSVLILMTWFRFTCLFVYFSVYCNCFDP